MLVALLFDTVTGSSWFRACYTNIILDKDGKACSFLSHDGVTFFGCS